MELEKIDALKHIKENPRIYLSSDAVHGHLLSSKIVVDALFFGAMPVCVDQQDSWWVVASNKNWICGDPGGVPTDELFERVHPNQKAGRNAMRNEILLSAYADQIVLIDNRVSVPIRIREDDAPPQFRLTESRDLKYGVAFTVQGESL